MKKTPIKLIISFSFLVLIFLLSACTQEPLFYYIATEYPPIDASIGGSPTKIVSTGNTPSDYFFVANRNRLYRLQPSDSSAEQPPVWHSVTKPSSEYIRDIAVSGTNIYVLDENGDIYESQASSISWGAQANIANGQAIYGTPSALYASNMTQVFAFSSFPSYSQISGPSGILSGAAEVSGIDYISVLQDDDNGATNGGIFDATTGSEIRDGKNFKGLIEFNGVLVSVAGGTVYYDMLGSEQAPSTSTLSGAMAIWDDGATQMLLLGVLYGSGDFAHGYRELYLSGGTAVIGTPGDSPADPNNKSYVASGSRQTTILPGSTNTALISKYPVWGLAALPPTTPYKADGGRRPVIYASTQQNGLWSYRYRYSHDNSVEWNGEDNKR